MELKKAVEYVNRLVVQDGQYGESWHSNKKRVQKIDGTTAFIYDSNFLVIAHKDRIYVYHEDDGMFCYHDNVSFDFASCFTYSLISLISEMQNYITLVGIPYHYAPERTTRCGFALGVDIDNNGRNEEYQPENMVLGGVKNAQAQEKALDAYYESLSNSNKWISTEDQLPPENKLRPGEYRRSKDYFVRVIDGNNHIYCDVSWYDFYTKDWNVPSNYKVTHWMPIPEIN